MLLKIKKEANALYTGRNLPAAAERYCDALAAFKSAGTAAVVNEEAKRIAAICMANRAQACLDLVKNAEAAEAAREAIALDPHFIKSFLRLGDALIQLHQFAAALQVFKHAATRFPSAEPALLALAASRVADLSSLRPEPESM